MKCILCSIDLSASSGMVVAWGAAIAQVMDLPLGIFHAVHQPGDPIHPSPEFERGGGLSRQRDMSEVAVEALMRSVRIPWRAYIEYGDPAETVQGFCRDHAVAMVVAGSKGIKGVQRLFMGTVVERMARMLPCPLMVIRPQGDRSPVIRRIGVACDGGDAGKGLIDLGMDLAARFGTDLHLLHAVGAAVDPAVVEPTTGPYGKVQEALKQRLAQRLLDMARLPDGSPEPAAKVHLVTGQAREALPDQVAALETDVLLVGVRPRRTLGQWMAGSATEALLRKAPCHVLVVPEPSAGDDAGGLKAPTPDMAVTAVVRSEKFLSHRCAGSHPETHQRLSGIYAMLDETASALPVIDLPARAASEDELMLVHSPAHVRRIAATAGQDDLQLTADTYTCRHSYEAARYAAGAVLAAIDEVMDGDARNAFVLNRPPGHHAESAYANGFCLFNNVAAGAAYARAVKGLDRVLIVDWDLHHGNGIQHIFEADPTVLYISTHQYPCFPGTGHYLEAGRARGQGYTLNLPLGKGWRDGEFVWLFQKIVAPVALSFDPGLILVAAGFDIHKKDPLGRMQVTEAGFAGMTRILMEVAAACCRHRLVLALEGGYHIKALAASVRAVLAELCEHTRTDPAALAAKARKKRVEQVYRRTAHVAGHTWRCLQTADQRGGRDYE